MLSREICKNVRNTFFTEHLFTVTASVYSEILGKVLVRNNQEIPCWQVFLIYKKIIENETAGEISSVLKSCTALIVSIFEQICFCFSNVFLMPIRSTEEQFFERPLYRCFLSSDHLPFSSNFC